MTKERGKKLTELLIAEDRAVRSPLRRWLAERREEIEAYLAHPDMTHPWRVLADRYTKETGRDVSRQAVQQTWVRLSHRPIMRDGTPKPTPLNPAPLIQPVQPDDADDIPFIPVKKR